MNWLPKLGVFLLKNIIIFVIVAILLLISGFIAYDCANIYVTVNDGLLNHISGVMSGSDGSELNNFFTQDFIDNDQLLINNPYDDFIITDYTSSIRINKLWAWPWNNNTTIEVSEQVIDIEGTPIDMTLPEENTIQPPKWLNAKEEVELIKENGNWKVNNITVISYIIEIEEPTESNE